MADRPNEYITKNYFRRQAKLDEDSAKLYGSLKDNLENINQVYNQIAERINTPSTATLHQQGSQWMQGLEDTRRYMIKSREAYDKSLNEENVVNRIETKAAWRNLLFRVSTTAAVAFTLGLAYSIAGSVDFLYLPLQQKTITYYYEGKHHTAPPADPSKYKEPEKVVTVTGVSKGKPLSIQSPKPFAVAGEPKL